MAVAVAAASVNERGTIARMFHTLHLSGLRNESNLGSLLCHDLLSI